MAMEYDLGNVLGPQGETGLQGVSITNVSVNPQGNLIVTLSSGTQIDAGNISGDKGDKGDKGKSAYQQAQEGGYAGTEAQFVAELNSIAGKANANNVYTKAEVNALNAQMVTEVGTATLTNSKAYPFNNSDKTVSLTTPRDNLNYTVTTEVTAASGCVGEVVVYDKQLNGFKLRFTGSGTQATIKYYVGGGLTR